LSSLKGSRESRPIAEPLLTVAPDLCTGCGACIAVCPHRIPHLGPEGTVAPDLEAFCIACGHCVAVCPGGALRHRDLPAEGFLDEAACPAPKDVLAWLRRRRSVRSYEARAVSRKAVEELLEAGRYAPTGHNTRALGCVAVFSEDEIRRLREALVAFYRRVFRLVRYRVGRVLLRALVGPGRVAELREALPGMIRAEQRLGAAEDPLFHGAPAVLLFHAPPTETAETDCALAAAHAALLAPSLDLGTCFIGYASAALRRSPRLAEEFAVPRLHRVYAVLTLGYPSVPYRRLPPRPPLPVRYL